MEFGIPRTFEKDLGNQAEVIEPIKPNEEEISKEVIVDENDDGKKKVVPKKIENEAPEEGEITDDKILGYFNKKNKTEFKTIEDYQNSFVNEIEVEKIVEKEVNPYEDLLTDDDKEYFKYKKETKGRSRKEWDYLKQDLTKKSALELARDRVRLDTGLKLSDKKADAYLEKKLSIDLSESEIETNDEIELNGYAKPFLDNQLADQEKFRQPLEKSILRETPSTEEMVKLKDGSEVTKKEFEKFNNQREQYLNNIKEAGNSVTASNFKITIDDNGEKREVDFNYEYSKEDKHSMLSEASDVDASIKSLYQTEDSFDYAGLQEGMWWMNPKNQQKVIAAAMQQARAEMLEEVIADDNNVKLGRKHLQTIKKEDKGYGSLTGDDQKNGFGVKFSFKKAE